MNENELGNCKIYKDTNPSSIIDYVGNKMKKPLKRGLSQTIDYSKKKSIFFSKLTLDPIDDNQNIEPLTPVEEKYASVEESSFNSIENKRKESEIYYKNIFKQFKRKKINYQFSKFSHKNINQRIHNSSNKLYTNFKKSQTKIRNNNFFASTKFFNNDSNGNGNFSSFKEETNSGINSSDISKYNLDDKKSSFHLDIYSDTEIEKKVINKTIKKKKYKDFQEKIKEIKKKFYYLISIFYMSLFLLCLKISLQLSMPKTPALGVSLFIINFNNIIISLLFIKLDQIEFKTFLSIKFGNILLTIFFNYLKILLLLKSLQHLNLLTFILMINMTPFVISYIIIREKNQSFTVSDSICYIIFIIICLSEFLIHNKISMICTFTLMMINTFMGKINKIRNFHSYLVYFWSSVIGVAISPLIMSINEDYLNISISQFLLFFIISLTYFLNHYFKSKLTSNVLEQGFQIYSNALIFFLYILYSNFLLRENNYLNSYLFLSLSFFIHIHSKFIIESHDM